MCRILLHDETLNIQRVWVHHTIRNLENHSVELDILAEGSKGNLIQTEPLPRIVERVRYFKMQKEGVDIMCEISDRIRREGKEEGKRDGRIESILELLEELGKVPQRIVQHIRQETNTEVLGKWLKDAARASSIAEFESHM